MRRFSLSVVALGVCLIVLLSSRDAAAGRNLLENPGFERGEAKPAGWITFSPPSRGLSRNIRYAWDDTKCHSGKRSVSVQSPAIGTGMWQQVVPVEGQSA